MSQSVEIKRVRLGDTRYETVLKEDGTLTGETSRTLSAAVKPGGRVKGVLKFVSVPPRLLVSFSEKSGLPEIDLTEAEDLQYKDRFAQEPRAVLFNSERSRLAARIAIESSFALHQEVERPTSIEHYQLATAETGI